MIDFVRQLRILFYRLALTLLVYSFSRAGLYFFNKDLFEGFSFSLWAIGLRFDLVSMLAFNSLFIILSIIPGKIAYSKNFQKTQFWVFMLTNIFAIGANLTDIIYYRFTFKRSTFDVFDIFANDSEMWWLIPKFILDFWPIFFALIFLCVLLVLIVKKIRLKTNYRNLHSYSYISEIGLSVFIILLTLLGIRGGFQLRPLSIIDANTMVESKNTNLILNTPFTLIKTIGKEKLENKAYFSKSELASIYSPFFLPEANQSFRNKNVVIIIMESMSAEFCGFLNPGKKSYTPFLDSLSQKCLYATNCLANGKKSIDGIPAILSSFPSLMNNAYISSAYASNDMGSIADALKSQNYNSAFFHGGNNGTMGFDNFTKSIGFNAYFGRNEYNNDKDFDGKWGIFDVPFFNFTANKIKELKQPFACALFSLSAHHPYTIPSTLKAAFPYEELPVLPCIRYADFALNQFFNQIKNEDWFSNTIFVITADHTAENSFNTTTSVGKSYSIPLLFYAPGDSLISGKSTKVCQQIDILPSILDYLNYPLPYFCFGKSIFENANDGFSIAFKNNNYLWSANGIDIEFTNEKTYTIRPKNNQNKEFEIKRLKAFIQIYNQSLNDNKLKLKK